MRKRMRLAIMLLAFMPLLAVGQTVIKGSVSDSETQKPVSAAIITILDSENETVAFGIASEQGMFSISFDSDKQKLLLVCRAIGYRDIQLHIDNKPEQLHLKMEQTGIELNEVVIKSNPIIVNEDTIKYSVNTFKSVGDRTIGDVLKKLPGIEVSDNGQIKYKGETINKFYIEGIDLLEGRYGIATNNVPVDAVQNVQVIENHQPINSIKGMIASSKAAINLKLKDDKMNRPIGGVRAGGGYSDNMDWLFEIFALQASKRRQAIGMYKTNNTGNNISHELNEHTAISISGAQGEDTGLGKSMLSSSSMESPPIEEQRYLFNQSHVATLNNLWRTSKTSQLRFNANYLNDHVSQNKSVKSEHFLPDSTIQIDETDAILKRTERFEGGVNYTDNATNFYLENALKWKLRKENSNALSSVNGNTLLQRYELPYYSIENKLDFLKRWDTKLLNIGTQFIYAQQPKHLAVEINGERSTQEIDLSNFYSKTETYYSWAWQKSRLLLKANAEIASNSIGTLLSDAELPDSISSKLHINDFMLELTPVYTYKLRKWELKWSVPIKEQIFVKKDREENNTATYNYFFINTNANLSYTFSPYLSSELSYKYQNNVSDYTDFINTYIMRDYRSFTKPSGTLSKRESQSYAVSFHYKNPFSVVFANAQLSYVPSARNKMISQRYVGIRSFSTDIEAVNHSDLWMTYLYFGKYFSSIKTNLSLTSNVSLYKTAYLRQNSYLPTSNQSLALTFKSNTKITGSINTIYSATYLRNKASIKTAQSSFNSSIHTLGQQLSTYIAVNKRLNLSWQLEHTYNETSQNNAVNMLFADMGITYKFDKMDVELNCNNIFNERSYSYSIVSDLDTYFYQYRIRPRSVILIVSFRF